MNRPLSEALFAARATEAKAMKAQAGLLEVSLDYLLSRDELTRMPGASAK